MMRLLSYDASKDVAPANTVELMRCYHGKRIGIHVRHGMRCHTWIWRMCK